MRIRVSKPAFVLSTMIAVLATVASAGGQFVGGLHRDNAFVISIWLGADIVMSWSQRRLVKRELGRIHQHKLAR